MRTEELVRSAQQREGQGASLALVERVPPKWRITDERAKAVGLSRAGYVLHFGSTYKLKIAAFAEGEPLPDVRLASRPSWVLPESEVITVEEHGQRFACLPFQVRRQTSWIGFRYWLGEIHSDNIEIEATATSAAGQDRRHVTCPVLAGSRWLPKMIVAAVLGGMLFGVVDVVVQQAVHAASALVTGDVAEKSWQIPWGWPVFRAAISLGLAMMTNINHVVSRSRELQNEFRRRWPKAAS